MFVVDTSFILFVLYLVLFLLLSYTPNFIFLSNGILFAQSTCATVCLLRNLLHFFAFEHKLASHSSNTPDSTLSVETKPFVKRKKKEKQ